MTTPNLKLIYTLLCDDVRIEMGNKIIEIDINYKDIAGLVEKWSGSGSGSVSNTDSGPTIPTVQDRASTQDTVPR